MRVSFLSTSIFINSLLTINVIFAQKPKEEKINIVSFDYEVLNDNLEYLRNGGVGYERAMRNLISSANSILTEKPLKVTDGDEPPSKNVHDFYSIGKLAWQDSSSNQHLYLRKDGSANPAAFEDRYDLKRFEQTLHRVNVLSMAWYFTSDERYASKAKQLLHVWFIDEPTAMNPNMKHAAVQPGVNQGMAIGIIFSVSLIETLDHIKLLQSSNSWDVDSHRSMKAWVKQYAEWLESSKFGDQVSKARNNHGSWYLAQLTAYKLFTDDLIGLSNLFQLAKEHMREQIEIDGSLPAEIKRISSFSYSIYGLRSFSTLANALYLGGYDLWSYRTPSGVGLLTCFDFLSPYILGRKNWNYRNSGANSELTSLSMWWLAYKFYDSEDSFKAYSKIAEKLRLGGNWRMLYSKYRNY